MSERKYFFLGQKKIIFIGVMHCVRERLFSNFFLGKQLIENKLYFYFYKSFPLTKDNFLFTNFFYVTKHWKMRKTIFIEGCPMKQTERIFLTLINLKKVKKRR